MVELKPIAISEEEIARIIMEIRRRTSARMSAQRVDTFIHRDLPVAHEFARQTWIVVREHLERSDATGEREALANLVKSWDGLRTGDYPRDIVETWLADKMKPAIEAARRVLAP